MKRTLKVPVPIKLFVPLLTFINNTISSTSMNMRERGMDKFYNVQVCKIGPWLEVLRIYLALVLIYLEVKSLILLLRGFFDFLFNPPTFLQIYNPAYKVPASICIQLVRATWPGTIKLKILSKWTEMEDIVVTSSFLARQERKMMSFYCLVVPILIFAVVNFNKARAG